MSGLCCSVQNKGVPTTPRCFDLLSDLKRCCHLGISSGEEVRTGWRDCGKNGAWFLACFLKESYSLTHSGLQRAFIFLFIFFQFHSPAFILLTNTGSTENQPLKTFLRGVSPLSGVRYGVINKSASKSRHRRHNHEEFKVKKKQNTDILTEQGCFCLFVVRLTVRVLFEQL